MGRPRLPATERRADVGITPAPEVRKWVDENSGMGKRFRNRTHAFEWAIAFLMEQEQRHGSLEAFLMAVQAQPPPPDKPGRRRAKPEDPPRTKPWEAP